MRLPLTASGLSGGAQVVKKTIDTWLDTVGRERRGRAIDQLYEIFAAAGFLAHDVVVRRQ